MSVEQLRYFFSYTRSDSEFVLRLAEELRAVGVNLWLDQLDILGGQHWDRTIEKALKRCQGMVAVLSPEAVVSTNVMDEVSYALDEGKLVVPVLVRSCDIPFRLRRVQYIDFTDDYATGFSELLRALGIGQAIRPPESAAVREPAVQKPPLPGQPAPAPDALDLPEPTGLETEKAAGETRTPWVLAAICFVALIAVISIGVWLGFKGPPKPDVKTNAMGMKMVYIPAGSFSMGSGVSAAQLGREYNTDARNFEDEVPQHEVKISEGFWMGQTEVTQGQYEAVMNARPWSGKGNVQENPDNPAVYVSWDDATEFCRKLSLREGKTYRLPTEAEWEYACRAGTKTRFSFGDSRRLLEDYAWYAGNTYKVDEKYAHPVGQKKPNPWGLYDMHGNVFELCSDYYDSEYYSSSPSVDPNGPSSGTYRSVRSSSWGPYESTLRCSSRSGSDPADSSDHVGFRVVCSEL
jgi:formylglycine-generating enzyme required for sulfatase activity